MISKEELALARKQLAEQIERVPDGPQKEAARQQLASMSDEAISAMVEGQRTGERGEGQQTRSIFRMIVDGSVPSKKIDENKEAVAVVSIRPVSKGHVIVIPKRLARDAKEIPTGSMGLAKKIAAKMIAKLKANSTAIQTSHAFDETIVNVIPIYEKRVDVNSVPYEASEEELEEVYKLLRVVKKPKREIIRKTKSNDEEKVIKMSRRIP